MFISQRLLSAVFLCGLSISGWYSVLLARADVAFRKDNLASAQRAVRLVPSNAAYHGLLAELLEADGANPDSELAIATNLSPRDSRYWIRRAFRAEVEQKYAASEQYLMIANRVDRGFDPRWALMNYYFRRGRLADFWKSAGYALKMSYGDLDPIFRLCFAASDDPSRIRQILPPRRGILFGLFTYLVQHQQLESASGIAEELASGASAEETPALVDYCNRQMGHDNESSLRVWDALCRRQLVPFSELAPTRGRIVTNGDFTAPPLQQGFDWRYHVGNGVSAGPMDTGLGASISISGYQPDVLPIMDEEIPLTPGKQYFLSYEYRLIGDQPDSGLQWVIREAGSGDTGVVQPFADSPVFSAADWTIGHMTFSSGQRDAARLVLMYRRIPGTVRWQGKAEIRRVNSGLAQSDSPGPGSAK